MYTRPGMALLFSLIIIALTGCATEQSSERNFRFPIIMGDIDLGRTAFIELQCHQCHTVQGVDLHAWENESPVTLELGGKIIYVKTYAELVTSIINPNHFVSENYIGLLDRAERNNVISPMPFKQSMTVEQLINLVTFLNSRYILLEPYDYEREAFSERDYQQ